MILQPNLIQLGTVGQKPVEIWTSRATASDAKEQAALEVKVTSMIMTSKATPTPAPAPRPSPSPAPKPKPRPGLGGRNTGNRN